MNDHEAFEREVAAWLADASPSASSDRLANQILSSAGRTRQRPHWLALIKEPPMRSSSHVAVGSPMVRVTAIMVATLLLALMVAGAGVAGSRLLAAGDAIVVDQGGNGTTTTIAEAVAMAEDGDTILVQPGTYDESVTVTKGITIRGDGERESIVVELSVGIPPHTGCNAADLPTAFVFERSDATLENLTIRGDSARIIILGGAPLLKDLVLDGIGHVYGLDPGSSCVPTGLDIGEGSTATIANSVLTDTDVDIETGASPSFLDNEFTIGAIWMQGTGVDPVIRDNDIVDSVKWGISVGGGAKPVIEANSIANAETAIDIADSGWAIQDTGTDAIVLDNTISGSSLAGITVGAGAWATITNNELADNGVGISVRSDALVGGNRLRGGGTGIHIAGGSPSLVDNGVEAATGVGIWVLGGTSPTLSGNASCNNEVNLKIHDDATPDIDDTNEICEDAPEPAE